MPLLVTDVLDAGVPGQDSVVTLRQRILSEAALATLQREIDPKSRADAITMVDPRWNPARMGLPAPVRRVRGALHDRDEPRVGADPSVDDIRRQGLGGD